MRFLWCGVFLVLFKIQHVFNFTLTHQFRPVTFQDLSSHRGLVATMLDNTGLDYSVPCLMEMRIAIILAFLLISTFHC